MKKLGGIVFISGALVVIVTHWGFVVGAVGLLLFLQGLKQEAVEDLVGVHQRKAATDQIIAERIRRPTSSNEPEQGDDNIE